MSQKPRRIPVSSEPRKAARPMQDVATKNKQADNFPSVGMTLRSYQYDPKDRNNRRGQPVTVKRSRLKALKDKITLKRTVIVVALLVLIVGGYVGGKFAYNAHKLFGGNILNVLKTTELKGEKEGRVNILLAGNSADDPGHDGADLTDSIMIISIDTKSNKALLLSIPRDLWVDVDDGYQKINAAYVVGEADGFRATGYPDGGMGNLEQVVGDIVGMPIHYYALVNYRALKQAVDAVGGVDITIKSEDKRGIYDPSIDYYTNGPLVKLSNGTHHLNGQQALGLARARGDNYRAYGFAGSDFQRTEHQRQLLVALKSKAVSAGVLSNPARMSSLADAIGNNVKTDLKLDEVRRLYDISKLINGSAIQSLSLNDANGKNLLSSYATPYGQSALIPAAGIGDYSDIQAHIKRQTSSNPVVQESAKIVILNGTDVSGLASKVKNRLTRQDFIIDDIGDAGIATQSKTAIINTSGETKPATKAALVKVFGNNVTTQNPYANMYDADFIIVVGTDQNTSNTKATQ
jgi:polyisoprenyl-teichoic acid--peptidoglycan teichoic acid transferase